MCQLLTLFLPPFFQIFKRASVSNTYPCQSVSWLAGFCATVIFDDPPSNASGVPIFTKVVATITKEVDIITKEVDNITKEVNTLNKEVDTLTTEVNTINKEVDTITKEVDTITKLP